MAEKCPSCEEILSAGAKFCQLCGVKLVGDGGDTNSAKQLERTSPTPERSSPAPVTAADMESLLFECEVDTNHEYVADQNAVFSFRIFQPHPVPSIESAVLFKSKFHEETQPLHWHAIESQKTIKIEPLLPKAGEYFVKIIIRAKHAEGSRICLSGSLTILIVEKKRDLSSISINPTYDMKDSRAAAVDGSIKIQIGGVEEEERQVIRVNEGAWKNLPLGYDHEETELWIEEEISPPLPPPGSVLDPIFFKDRRMILDQERGGVPTKRFIFLAKGCVKIGRERKENDILAWAFPNPTTYEEKLENKQAEGTTGRVSREHAEIVLREDGFFIKDDKSTWGTFLGGRPLEHGKEYKLEDESEISLAGAVKYTVRLFCDRSPRTSSSMRKILRRGDCGPDVAYLQRQLKEKGFYEDSVDGIFGLRMEAAVRDFQKSNGLKQDGIAGEATLGRLGSRSRFGIERLGPIDALRLRRREIRPSVGEEYIILVKEAKIGRHSGNCLELDDPKALDIEARIYLEQNRFVFQCLDPGAGYAMAGKRMKPSDARVLKPGDEIAKSGMRFIVREFEYPTREG